ncbi:HD domain-containing protein [Halobacillus litoralis]|uniref:HD domain-containing protein n=1 Tax=Halobacillus litoralis TaxID=45668 RepID=UPI001CFE1718|nr:HD domain-containing protein [Halobacillus litoralis]
MEQTTDLKKVKTYVIDQFKHDSTGHDAEHMKRVAFWSRELALKENVDPFLCEISGWLHDVGDPKLYQNPQTALKERDHLLEDLSLSPSQIKTITNAIETVSFSKGKRPDTKVGEILQDADRLDAIGAIGIARTFAFGGARNQAIYKDGEGTDHSIGHFHGKLLKLASLMNTGSGRAEAVRRHEFMLQFLEEFRREQLTTSEKRRVPNDKE